jgi:hypothetical protein
MQAERLVGRSGSWLPWMLANFVGFAVGETVAGAVQRAWLQPYFEVVTSAAEAARIEALATGVTSTIFGVLIGTAQWLTLRRKFGAGWWIPATCLGWALGGVIGGVQSGVLGGRVSTIGPDVGWLITIVVGVPLGLLIGLLPGTFQWLLVRRQVAGAGWWPFVNLGGLLVGFVGGFAVARWGMVDVVHWLRPEDFPSAKALVLVGAVSGPLYAAVTWPALARMRR